MLRTASHEGIPMTMVAKSAARRLYTRSQFGLVLCFDGKYFGPKASAPTDLTKDDQVTVEVLKMAGGKHRIQVTQAVEDGAKAIVETWTEKELTFVPRAKKSA